MIIVFLGLTVHMAHNSYNHRMKSILVSVQGPIKKTVGWGDLISLEL